MTVFTGNGFNSNMQSVIIIIFLIISFILQIYFKPYVNFQLNQLENYATSCAIVTVLCGIIYTENFQNGGIRNLATAVIVIINGTFMIYFIRFIFREIIDYIIVSVKCLKERFHKKDSFDPEFTKDFSQVKFSYIKEFHVIYTQIEDDEDFEIIRSADRNKNYLGDKSLREIYSEIVKTDQKSYKLGLKPIIRSQIRRRTIFRQT